LNPSANFLEKLNTFFSRFSLFLFWSLLTLTTVLLLIELAPSKGVIPHFDKIVHASFFAALSFLGAATYQQQNKLVYIGLGLYGALTEWLQGAITTTRSASMIDWFADITGIIIGILLIRALKKRIY